MREITDHKCSGLNEAITIMADERDSKHGNMSHEYDLLYQDRESHYCAQKVIFQNGPIAEVGVNGVSNEALLAIVIDRLAGAQAGNYACEENHQALVAISDGLGWLHKRTKARLERGVEGTSKV